MLSMERSLFSGNKGIKNSTIRRMKTFARYFNKIFVISHTLKKHNLKEAVISDKIHAIPTNGDNTASSFYNMYQIGVDVCRKEKIDLIVTQDPFGTGFVGYLISKECKVPYSVSIFSAFFDNEYWIGEKFSQRILHPIGKFVVKNADSVRVECETERKKVIEMGVLERKVRIAPVMAEIKKFKSADGTGIRREYLDGFKKIVLYIGRFSHEKDLPTLVRAAAVVKERMPEALFLVVGGGEEEEKVKALAKNLECTNVLFPGKIHFQKVPSYHKAADVFVLPSLYEGIPAVAIEAHAAGRPVVTTDYRDAYDVIIQNKSGFIVKQGDYNAIAEKVIYLLRNPKLAQQMGAIGQKHVFKLFDTKRCLEETVRLWKDTAARRI
jgi:glycosyltransferase involved in cell wall biosynthesis